MPLLVHISEHILFNIRDMSKSTSLFPGIPSEQLPQYISHDITSVPLTLNYNLNYLHLLGKIGAWHKIEDKAQ